MAILVLARAYVRSRFTPTVFRSWRLAAGRLPCYFILCLLLLEATPQTKKVAMGWPFNGPLTAEGQDHHSVVGSSTPASTTWSDVASIGNRLWAKGDYMAGTVDKDSSNDFYKSLASMSVRERSHTMFTLASGSVKEGALCYPITIHPINAVKLVRDLRVKMGMGRKYSVALVAVVREKKVVSLSVLKNFYDFALDANGTDRAYIYNPKFSRVELSEGDIKFLQETSESLANAMTHRSTVSPTTVTSEQSSVGEVLDIAIWVALAVAAVFAMAIAGALLLYFIYPWCKKNMLKTRKGRRRRKMCVKNQGNGISEDNAEGEGEDRPQVASLVQSSNSENTDNLLP
eukprot:GHVS01024238.1.p1 GENE.GHVS01024238.1~~GHVS01024238.1.p1  ORF type:complete len:359 (+),score=25.64 GHVS01024238.1:47-1078(+)